jgi:hypothetical protein
MSDRFRFCMLALLFATLAVAAPPAVAATYHLEVMAAQGQSGAANSNEAYIIVRIANPDGTPKEDAKLESRQSPTGGGLELKGSNWGFATLLVPPGYSGRVVNAQGTQFEVNGQLRIMSMQPMGSGVYGMRVLPLYGARGSRKAFLRWVAGEYIFRISYQEGDTAGHALGKLTIR